MAVASSSGVTAFCCIWASAISAVNRQARKLTPGIEFNARLAGAIHTLDVTGTVTN